MLHDTVVLGMMTLVTVCMLYFAYVAHQVSQRQTRIERYLVTSARILSVCAGGLALPPLLQQVGRLFSHVSEYDAAGDAEWWAHLHRLSQQASSAAAPPPARDRATAGVDWQPRARPREFARGQ